MPGLVYEELRRRGWYYRARVPWVKRSSLPESVRDRPTTTIEHVGLFGHPDGGGRYYYDVEATKVTSRGKTGAAANFARNTKEADVPGQSCRQHRVGRKPTKDVGTRSRRDADWFFDSLRVVLDGGGGFVHSPEGDPLALVVNPKPCSWEFCGACGELYEGRERRRISKEGKGATRTRTCPSCGSSDGWIQHFASFPKRLVEPCLLASTSARGACSDCGAQWQRVTGRACRECGGFVRTQAKRCEACGHVNDWKTARFDTDSAAGEAHGAIDYSTPGRATPRKTGSMGSSRTYSPDDNERDGGLTTSHGIDRTELSHWQYDQALKANPKVTGTWEPSCACGLDNGGSPPPEPSVVLDPFGGAGTVAMVAVDHGRRAVYVDAAREYRRVAVARVSRVVRDVDDAARQGRLL
ncbi:MAG: hypothetical protein ACE5JM_13970 [Armatimonadota bacterium]